MRRGAHVSIIDDWGKDPEKEHEAAECVHLHPPGRDEWCRHSADLAPVKSDDAHAEPCRDAEELIDDDVGWAKGLISRRSDVAQLHSNDALGAIQQIHENADKAVKRKPVQ